MLNAITFYWSFLLSKRGRKETDSVGGDIQKKWTEPEHLGYQLYEISLLDLVHHSLISNAAFIQGLQL